MEINKLCGVSFILGGISFGRLMSAVFIAICELITYGRCLILAYSDQLLEWVVFHSLKSGKSFISPLKMLFYVS